MVNRVSLNHFLAPFVDRKLQPLLYISYGIPKTGSTFAYEYTRRVFEINKIPQPRLSNNAVEESQNINFFRHWDNDELIDNMLSEAKQINSTVVIKTHTASTERVMQLAKEGLVAGHIVYRDPRDIALSLLDHAERSRRNGEIAFSTIKTIDDAVKVIKNRLAQFYTWVNNPNFFAINYEDLTSSNSEFESLLKAQTGLRFSHSDMREHISKNCFTQFNKGYRRRYEVEMSGELSDMFLREFSDFYGEYFNI